MLLLLKSEGNKIKADIADELLARTLDAAAGIENLWRSTEMNNTRYSHKSCNADSGIFENLLWNVTHLWFLCNKWLLKEKYSILYTSRLVYMVRYVLRWLRSHQTQCICVLYKLLKLKCKTWWWSLDGPKHVIDNFITIIS